MSLKKMSQRTDTERLGTQLLGWTLRPGPDKMYYNCGEGFVPYESFQPFTRIQDAYIIWAFLVLEGYVVSACWGPVDLCSVRIFQADGITEAPDSSFIEAQGNNLCQTICQAALELIDESNNP